MEEKRKTPLVCGLLAHVDAGKTTLSEALLCCGGVVRSPGRVDHGDAYLDTDSLERERGITIFSKQAVIPLPERTVTILDTPGHVDFSSEMERTLQVLDCAILVISGTDGVQGHTQTVWRLLKKYRIPTFLFINKMDLVGADRESVLVRLREELSPACVDFTPEEDRTRFYEEISVLDDTLMERYLEGGAVEEGEIAELIARRQVFPCFFGSALKMEGVAEFLEAFQRYAPNPMYPETFGARVFKIARDAQGGRLTYMKITGGSLAVKTLLNGTDPKGGEPWQEKADQLRIYSGAKYTTADRVEAGTVCAVTGLDKTWAGEGLGHEGPAEDMVLQPVMSCEILLPPEADAHVAMQKLQQLEEEQPQLHILWNERLQKIQLQMMGEVQLDVLKRVISERFGMEVEFAPGRILYRETIAAPVEGIGHFEPLRHYAEVHLLLEPLPRGSGLRFASCCSEDVLDRNWQRLIFTHLMEKEHLGVLTGSPITDMQITLAAGRAHVKHTEGGDFRQATYRAVRQGLMQAESILLEPWYAFRMEVPGELVGRAMSDIQRMGGEFTPPETLGSSALLVGRAPVSAMRGYPLELAGYSRGQGRISCVLDGYEPCQETDKVVEAMDYDPVRDLDNTPDSVFCAHGAGFVVPWDQVARYAQVDSGLRFTEEPEPEPQPVQPSRPRVFASSAEEEAELTKIFERTYGPAKERNLFRSPERPRVPVLSMRPMGPEYLLVDGYNIIFAWDELKTLARESLAGARKALEDILCNYQGFRKCQVILVFDAYKVKGNVGTVEKHNNIYIVYTKEAETADMYIEKATYQLAQHRRVRVATSDGLEQMIILGHGAVKISAENFHQEVERANEEIHRTIEEINRKSKLPGGPDKVTRWEK